MRFASGLISSARPAVGVPLAFFAGLCIAGPASADRAPIVIGSGKSGVEINHQILGQLPPPPSIADHYRLEIARFGAQRRLEAWMDPPAPATDVPQLAPAPAPLSIPARQSPTTPVITGEPPQPVRDRTPPQPATPAVVSPPAAKTTPEPPRPAAPVAGQPQPEPSGIAQQGGGVPDSPAPAGIAATAIPPQDSGQSPETPGDIAAADHRGAQQLALAVPPPDPGDSTAAATTISVLSTVGGETVRIVFPPGEATFDSPSSALLDRMTDRVRDDMAARIQIHAYAGDPDDNRNRARRLSLTRALAVRSYLMKAGASSTQLDVRALGARAGSGPPDRVDVQILKR